MSSTYADAHSRRFGVEIECGMPGGYSAARRLFGLESYYAGTICGIPGWSVGSDGSGVELRTPILQGEQGYDALREVMERLKAEGAYVTNADGMHVHHDAPEFVESPEQCLRLVRSWINNIDSIHEMVAPRRRQSGACPSWQQRDLNALNDWLGIARARASDPYDDRYYDDYGLDRNDLNLAALDEHGSIEFRLHEGTLDADVAVSWIQFGQRFLHETLDRKLAMRASPNDLALMSRLKLSAKARAVLEAKKAAAHVTEGSRYLTRHPRDEPFQIRFETS